MFISKKGTEKNVPPNIACLQKTYPPDLCAVQNLYPLPPPV